jgi:hypothetical protein
MGRTIPSYRIATEIERSKWKTGKPHIKRGRKRKKKGVLYHDTDINLEMKTHGNDNVRVLYDSNPR